MDSAVRAGAGTSRAMSAEISAIHTVQRGTHLTPLSPVPVTARHRSLPGPVRATASPSPSPSHRAFAGQSQGSHRTVTGLAQATTPGHRTVTGPPQTSTVPPWAPREENLREEKPREEKPKGEGDSEDTAGATTPDLVDVSCKQKHEVPTLVLMRHGESMWNHLKLFTGDVDIPLTEKGVMEAMAGGRSVSSINFGLVFTSRLMRSKQTALLAMTQNQHRGVPVLVRGGYHGTGHTGDANRIRLRAAAAQALQQAECRMVPVYADPALNERCYGDLQGLNKEAAEKAFGHELVAKWRRSHDTRPPKGESLKDTWERTLGFFMSTIEPRLADGRNVLVVAHGNVLRCIISYLCHLSEEDMLRLQVATAVPYLFQFQKGTFTQCPTAPEGKGSPELSREGDSPGLSPSLDDLFSGVCDAKGPLGQTSSLELGAVDSLI